MWDISCGKYKQSIGYIVTYKGELVVLNNRNHPTKIFKTKKGAARDLSSHIESAKRRIKYAYNDEQRDLVKDELSFLVECTIEEVNHEDKRNDKRIR